MSRYIIQSESLTSIADEIRVLSGTEDNMSPNAMGTKLQEANSDVNTEADLISQIMVVLEGKTDIVIPEVKINTATAKLSSNGTSISFTGLESEPEMFAISPTGNITLGTTRYVTGIMYDGEATRGTYGYRARTSATSYHSSSYFTWTYSDGTLTVNTSSTTNGGYFSSSVTYQLAYATTTEGSIGGGSSGGSQLPELSNEGAASDLLAGKQLIDGNGNVVIGTHECETGGYEVITGTVTGVSGTAKTVNCGFKPDAVFFTGTIVQMGNTACHAGVAFTEKNVTSMSTIFAPPNTNYLFSVLTVTQTSSGFSVSGIRFDTALSVGNESNRSLSYVAIKYTE